MLFKLSIKVYIIITLIHFLVAKTNNMQLKYILIISGANVIITDILKYLNIETDLNLNAYVILNAFFWLQIIIFNLKKQHKSIMSFLFIVVTILSFSFVDIHKFYHNYFVISSIVYILIFFRVCIKHLKHENITFFQSNNFILLFAPVLFFFGMSFIFGFKSSIFSNTYLFEGINVYGFINFLVNLVYYSLLNHYILKSRSYG